MVHRILISILILRRWGSVKVLGQSVVVMAAEGRDVCHAPTVMRTVSPSARRREPDRTVGPSRSFQGITILLGPAMATNIHAVQPSRPLVTSMKTRRSSVASGGFIRLNDGSRSWRASACRWCWTTGRRRPSSWSSRWTECSRLCSPAWASTATS